MWLEAIAVHNAVGEGVRAARAEKAGWDRLQQMPMAEVG